MDGITPIRTVFIAGFIIACVYFLTTRVSAARARQLVLQQHGCKDPPVQTFKDPLFALDGIYDVFQAVKSGKFLQNRREQYEVYGNTFASKLATTKVLSTIEPENFKALLSTNFKDYVVGSGRRLAFGPVLGNSVLVADGVAWEHSRALLRPSFNRNQTRDLVTLETHVQALIDVIPKDGSTVDLQDLFLRLTADVTTDFLFGESIQSLSKADALDEELFHAFQLAQRGVERRFQLGKLAFIVPDKPFDAAVKKIHAYMDVHVNKAIQIRKEQVSKATTARSDSKKYVFLEELAKATSDHETLRYELLGIFAAGRDTTAALLANLFHVLARNPRVFQRLQEEISRLNGEKPGSDHLKSMSYLNACINETLRLYPVAQGSSRVTVKDTILPRGGGPDGTSPILVLKNTMVIHHYFALHLRKDLWGEDAFEYRPERWEERTQRTRTGEATGWDFLPFGGGPRNCIGQQFALLEASYTSVRLLQEFKRVESRDMRPWAENVGATFSNANGVKVAMFM
ncbi:hypothetical protein P7C71_g1987, partial [Lecanoromycetidae sp. Uapishka_2]